MNAPYRDENESLRAENERLRAALSKRRRSSGGLALFLLAVELGALFLFMPWLNAPSDAKFGAASLVLGAIAVAAVAAAFGYRRG